MSTKVKDTDHGFKKIIEGLKGPLAVSVGIQGDAGSDLVMIGAVQEFGSADGHIPERSFLRATIDQERDALLGKFENLLRAAAHGKQTTEQAIDKFGLLVVSAVRRRIRGRQTVGPMPQENAASTIARKGSSTPLIDTGRLVQSIRAERA